MGGAIGLAKTAAGGPVAAGAKILGGVVAVGVAGYGVKQFRNWQKCDKILK